MSDPKPVRTPSAAKWDCHSCGDCCRLYDLGPVEPDIVMGLVERQIDKHWKPAAEQPWLQTRRAPDGREAHFFTHKDGHCVFLRDDNLCAIHGLFGAEAKPGFCREFPFHVVDDPRGSVVVVRPSCVSYHRGFENGTPVEAQADAAIALPRVMGRRKFAPAEVAVLPDAALPLDLYMDWEARLLAALDPSDHEPETAIVALRGLLYAAAGKPAPEPDPRRARLAVGAVIEALRRLMERAANDPNPNAEAHRVAFARDCRDLLVASLDGQQHPRALAADTRAYLALLLRTFVIAKGFHAIGSVADGLGAFLVQVAVVRAIEGDGPVTADEAGPVIVKWTKLTENPAIAGVLRMARPALFDAFANVETR